jgi:hypothetical protein
VNPIRSNDKTLCNAFHQFENTLNLLFSSEQSPGYYFCSQNILIISLCNIILHSKLKFEKDHHDLLLLNDFQIHICFICLSVVINFMSFQFHHFKPSFDSVIHNNV